MNRSDIGVLHLDSQKDLSKDDIGELMYKSLRSLIAISRLQQLSRPFQRTQVGDSSWLHEYCTIKCGSSRMAGHSSAIARYIIEKNAKALVLSVSSDAANIVKSLMENKLMDETDIPFVSRMRRIESDLPNGFRADFSSIDSFTKSSVHGMLYDIIFVDCASCVTTEEKMSIQMSVRNMLPLDKPFHLVYME